MPPCKHFIPRRLTAGFAYLWVLLTVALMGLALTMAVEVDLTTTRRDREKELLAIGRQFRAAIGSYYERTVSANQREYPARLEDLLQDERDGVMRRHLRKIFVDPMTGKAEWEVIRVGGRIVGIHSTARTKPIKQAGFEAEDVSFGNKNSYSEWIFTYPPGLEPVLQRQTPSR